MLAFMGFFLASLVLYEFSQSMLWTHNYASYWPFKFLFVSLVAVTGIVISAVLEECVIAQLTVRSRAAFSCYTSVVRANYVTLGLILLVAALKVLPERWNSPHFLVTSPDRFW